MFSQRHYIYMDESSVNPFLFCSICKHPLVDPVRRNATQQSCRSCAVSEAVSLGCQNSFVSITEPIILKMLDDLIVQCRLCNETNLKRGYFPFHLAEECSGAMVSCSAADLKCPWKGKRSLLDQHIEQCPIMALRPVFQVLLNENSQLKNRLYHLEKLDDSMNGKVTAKNYFQENLVYQINESSYGSIVNLQSKKISDDDIDLIVQYAIERKRCTALDLNSNKITGKGMPALIKSLKQNRNVQKLYLANNQIGDEGLHVLAELFTDDDTQITDLSIESNRITDVGVCRLVETLSKNRTLKYLGLSANQISNIGVKYFINWLMSDDVHLQELHLSGQRGIDDDIIDDFLKLVVVNRSLRCLSLIDCRFSDDSKAKLRSLAKEKHDFELRM